MKSDMSYLIRKICKLAELPPSKRNVRYLNKKQLLALIIYLERLKEDSISENQKKD